MANGGGNCDTHGSGIVVLENEHVRVGFSADTGSVVQLENRLADLRLVQHPVCDLPWRIEIAGHDGAGEWIEHHSSFQWSMDDPTRVELTWETPSGLGVDAVVQLPSDASSVSFSVSVRGAPGIMVDKIEYPILTGIGDLHDAVDSILAHTQGTGFLFRRPYHLFESEPFRRQGLRYSPYPEGFNGSTMQFMAYYAEGIGGFQVETLDPAGSMKWFNFYKGETGALESSVMHQSPDMRPGYGLEVPYPIVIGALQQGTWYEAVDRYKQWAVQQPWTAQGTLAERDDCSRWLLDEVGFATFGVNAAHDRSGWLDRFHAITRKPVFHVLGVNWPKTESGYGRGHPGGRDDWFPANFSQENLDTIRLNGDYWAPFEFDLLLATDRAESEAITASQLQLPEQKYSFDQYRFPFQCPATDYLPELHRWRDTELAGTYGADALYYDISANNVLMTCRNPDHGHLIGGGGWMVDAYADMWANTGESASGAKGGLVPQGAEMISELFVPYLDFYQARAEASPLSAFEADFFRDWIRTGHVEKIPMFAYVYHEYGPVRMDGWGKLSREAGELWYWVASRVALWGGLFELNYEFSDLEKLEGFEDHPNQHYAEFERRAYTVDPEKVAFVREIANARTGFARPWLVYGTMQPPLDIEVGEIPLDYHLYNVNQSRPHYDEKGTMHVSSVVHMAWRDPDGRLGFFFVNLLPDETQTVSVQIDPIRYGAPAGSTYTLRQVTSDDEEILGKGEGLKRFDVTLEPRKVELMVMDFEVGRTTS